MHIDICALPSFDVEKRHLLNHYNLILPTEGLLVPVQSLSEILADKFIALAYRSRRIKPRDIWDILWLRQRGIAISTALISKKLEARKKSLHDFYDALQNQVSKILLDDEVRTDFNNELSRFIPLPIKSRTVDNPDYWPYIQREMENMTKDIVAPRKNDNAFNMG
jgi:hypothetical protein